MCSPSFCLSHQTFLFSCLLFRSFLAEAAASAAGDCVICPTIFNAMQGWSTGT
ncbi:hypothetical protein OIU78_007726, partial [Salix suchowensis]